MPDNTFFEEQEEQSRVKSEIVAKYFWAWAKVMLPRIPEDTGRIAYLDLFAGPGAYQDGTPSTPLLVLQKAISEPAMRARLLTIFCDADPANVTKLRTAIAALPGIDTLANAPLIENLVVDDDLADAYSEVSLHPTLLFADPWGYKGVTQKLIRSVLKDWGCECLVFFNYRRINMALANDLLREPMNALFGADRVERLRAGLSGLSPEDRELAIIEEFVEAQSLSKKLFVLPFRFRDLRGTRTTHHLVFMSKNVLGYTMMKDIMAKESSGSQQGVAQLEYNPATHNFPMLFEYNRPLDDLGEILLVRFAGQRLKMVDVFHRHQVGTPFVKKNYKSALANLEASGKIVTVPPANERRCTKGKPTFADDVEVHFPAR
jgi:three-Cys-motif partner protein